MVTEIFGGYESDVNFVVMEVTSNLAAMES